MEIDFLRSIRESPHVYVCLVTKYLEGDSDITELS